MKKYNLLLLCFLTVGVLFGQTSNNLLPIEDWDEGSGNVAGWVDYGTPAANIRQETIGPDGTPVLGWHCLSVPGEGGANGGFYHTLSVDPTKAYRYSVWVRRNDTNSGSTYYRAWGSNSTFKLDGTAGGVSQFWYGDLPTIGDWYLMVGYIHETTHTGLVHYGGIYDTNGKKVINMVDFKWQPTASVSAIYPFFNSGADNHSQDLYAPRVEVINGNEPSLMTLLEIPSHSPQSGNLLTPKDWTEGTGSVGNFTMMSPETENSRALDIDPRGETSMIWTAADAGTGGTDGGFYTTWSTIDHTKTYRFVQWIRKRGHLTNGVCYFGAGNGSSTTTPNFNLSGTPNTSGYFFGGDLPKLDQWYMMVGYVHGSDYTGTVSMGGIYDTETGQKVLNMTDFKNRPGATQQRLRTFLNGASVAGTAQDMWGVRMEMIDGNEPTLESLLNITSEVTSGNLLPTEDWNIGNDGVSIFARNGDATENIREIGIDPHGESSVIWTGLASGNSGGDGGWNANFPVDHTKSYRFSVWVKRDHASVGATYLGAMNGSTSQTLNLSGTPNTNPYFWAGDLPEVDKWYLLVGYLHGSGYTGTTSIGKGGVYDGETGEKVLNATDYKNSTATTTQRHRAYFYYSTTAGLTQNFWGPRAEMIDGNEPTIEDLLSIDNGPHIWSEITNGAVYNSGSVGIGVDDNDMDTAYKLLVDGDIKTRKVKVTLDGWADYVFDPGYTLPPLADVESYIKENGHLPGIPSEEEVMEEGVYLGETDVMLLKKIEELTLYVIELEKKLKALEDAK